MLSCSLVSHSIVFQASNLLYSLSTDVTPLFELWSKINLRNKYEQREWQLNEGGVISLNQKEWRKWPNLLYIYKLSNIYTLLAAELLISATITFDRVISNVYE